MPVKDVVGGVNMTLLQALAIICPFAAMFGAVVSGLVLAKSDHHTKWASKLGRWGLIGVVMLFFGMLGWLYTIGQEHDLSWSGRPHYGSTSVCYEKG
jgi:hypothetical protein